MSNDNGMTTGIAGPEQPCLNCGHGRHLHAGGECSALGYGDHCTCKGFQES
ncbi:MAG: hypothetical protein GIW99_02670 [Candidatus Eremiobacteraeota bacterium]|nr:hypothetical protein [Candidatus Eremiobacteraeota bacterium]MBC5826578.1 hypothetical protein [Candidatus Eremiobacteraeota bacterium]